MEAKNLRVGNNVRYEHGPIIELGIHDLYRLHDKYITLKPIILDQTRLIQLGFKKLDKYTFVNKSMFIYHRKRGFVYGSRKREVNCNMYMTCRIYFLRLLALNFNLNWMCSYVAQRLGTCCRGYRKPAPVATKNCRFLF